MSPDHDALTLIRRHPGTGSAGSLAKLVLSLWNADCGFSVRACLANLMHLAAHGEDADLIAAGHELCRDDPRLWELGQTGEAAKQALRAAWDRAPAPA
jgi:hypothetical protein